MRQNTPEDVLLLDKDSFSHSDWFAEANVDVRVAIGGLSGIVGGVTGTRKEEGILNLLLSRITSLKLGFSLPSADCLRAGTDMDFLPVSGLLVVTLWLLASPVDSLTLTFCFSFINMLLDWLAL